MSRKTQRKLVEVSRFGANPGALKAWIYIPDIVAPQTALVVVLHGCTQTAEGFDHGAGWSQLADRNGFALLFPEQQRTNNANLCFNWFEPSDTRRGRGEAESIHQMIDHVAESHGIDRKKVFVTGLSAGGAMANVMLAAYPDVFAGGAIIGGLAYGVTSGVSAAFERMHGRNPPTSAELRSAVMKASGHGGPWPAVSVWQGTHDHTVKPINAEQIIQQWLGVHDVAATSAASEAVNGHTKRSWVDGQGRALITHYSINGMAHGVPLAATADNALGFAGPYMLDARISSTARIARSWGLASDRDVVDFERGAATSADNDRKPEAITAVVEKAMSHLRTATSKTTRPNEKLSAVSKVINDALKSAGLIK